jgi:hypothetical protein
MERFFSDRVERSREKDPRRRFVVSAMERLQLRSVNLGKSSLD